VIEPVSTTNTIRGTFQVWEYRQTNAQLFGVDLNASYAFNELMQFNHQLSIVKGQDKTQNESLINMPPVNTTNEIVYYNNRFNNLRLALQSEYVFRQNEFPNTNFEVYIPNTETYVEVDVSTSPSAYHLLNFNSSIDFDSSERFILTLGFQVTNLLYISYRNYLNRMRLFADDLGRNFLLNIKLKY
jgi:iron complex outermembrane receptor protein